MDVALDLVDARLLVRDIGRTLAFYRDSVGLSPKLVVEGTYVEFETGTATLTAYRADLMRQVVGGGAAHTGDALVLVFRVPDVDAAYIELKGRDVEFVTGPHDQEDWGIRVAHFRDPDGHLVEIYHPIEPSPAEGGTAGVDDA